MCMNDFLKEIYPAFKLCPIFMCMPVSRYEQYACIFKTIRFYGGARGLRERERREGGTHIETQIYVSPIINSLTIWHHQPVCPMLFLHIIISF